MLINELSKRTGITAHTIRFYENNGLLQGQVDEAVKSNNYKHYDESHIERIEIIREAQEVGFTLAEIKNLLEKWYSGNFFKDDQLDFFDVKLKEIDSKINQLKQMKKRLEEVRKLIESGVCQ